MGSLGGKAPLASCIVFWAMRWAFRVRGNEGYKENSECSHVRVSIKNGWSLRSMSNDWHTAHVASWAEGPTYQQFHSASAVVSLGQLRTTVHRLGIRQYYRSSIFQMW